MVAPHRLFIHLALLLAASLLAGCAAFDDNGADRGDGPYLVLVSLDGFRWDYDRLTDTPALDRMARDGLKAEALQPVFPTITFPNHFSIATGLHPWAHGIVANDFPDADRERWYSLKDRNTVQDGSWYLAEPIWVTAENAGLRSAAYYFVGTEADIGGVRPSHWRAFDASVPNSARVAQVLDWLSAPAQRRPQLVTLYFEEVDDQGHRYGPESDDNRAAIREVDTRLGELLEGISQLPHGDRVHVILVSDHGQGRYDPNHEPFVLEEWIDLEETRIVNGGPYAFVYLENGGASRAAAMRDVINGRWACGRAWLPDELPGQWNAGSSERYPDLFVIANRGCAVLTTEAKRAGMTAGDHGWAPDVVEMRGIFYAVGPRIPAGARTGVVHATDIYPMMLEILGLEAPGPFHGDPDVLAAMLRPEKE